MTPTLDIVKEWALEAGELIKQLRSGPLTLDYKPGNELVTNADVASDRLITEHIRAAFPGHQILAEESANRLQDIAHLEGPLWIIDPIDGTVNYAHGHSQVAVSIAYFEQGVPQLGVVHAPFQNETFSAQRGQGAWLNDQPITPNRVADLKNALIGTGFPYHKEPDMPLLMARLETVLRHCADVRRNGSAALDICWVACGRLTGYYESVSLWDCAAAQLIAIEAGARYGHIWPPINGLPTSMASENLLVTNPLVFDELQMLLAEQ